MVTVNITPSILLLGNKSNGWSTIAKVITCVWCVAVDVTIVVLAVS